VYKTRALVKSRRKAPTPEWENIQVDTKVQEEGFGEIPKESTYARAGVRCVGPKDEGEGKGTYPVSAKELKGGNCGLVMG